MQCRVGCRYIDGRLHTGIDRMNRRDFLLTGVAAGTLAVADTWTPAFARPRGKLRLGMIGTGLRGQSLMGSLLGRGDVDMVALCDIEPIMLGRAVAAVEKAGQPAPVTFGADRRRARLPSLA